MTDPMEVESKSVFCTLTLTCEGKEDIYLAPTVWNLEELHTIFENYPGFRARIDYSENLEWKNLIFLPKKEKPCSIPIQEYDLNEIPF